MHASAIIPARTAAPGRCAPPARPTHRVPPAAQALVASFVLLVLAAAAPAPAAAQMGTTVGVIGGVTQYDLSGTGTVPFGALRVRAPVGMRLWVEGGLGYMAYDTQGGVRSRLVLPEAQLQAELTRTALRPYLGAGAGIALERVAGTSAQELTLSAAGGVRAAFAPGWEAAAELRVRAVDPWAGSMADWGLGVARRF
jgi:hypothetical protein